MQVIAEPGVPLFPEIALATRRGTRVKNGQPQEITVLDGKVDDDLRAKHRQAVFRTPPVSVYNCHEHQDGKRRGRPRLAADEDSVAVHMKLPASQYDELYRRASVNRVSVPEQIRREMRAARARAPEDE